MNLLLDSSLFDLKTKKRLWSALSLTKVNEDEDKLVVADALVAKIVNRLHQDGLVSR
jgi:Mn-dependent DtxR family transcriptional regulator